MKCFIYAFMFIIGFFKVMIPILWGTIIEFVHNLFVQKSINKGCWLSKNYSVLYKDIHMDAVFILRLISGIMKLCCMSIRFDLPEYLELMLDLFIRILYNPRPNEKLTLTKKLKAIRTTSYKLEELWYIHEFSQATIWSESDLKNKNGEIILPLITLYQQRAKDHEMYATFHHLGLNDEGRSVFNIVMWISDLNEFKQQQMLDMVENVNKKLCNNFNNKITEVFNITTERLDANHARVVIRFEMEAYSRSIFDNAKIMLLPVD